MLDVAQLLLLPDAAVLGDLLREFNPLLVGKPAFRGSEDRPVEHLPALLQYGCKTVSKPVLQDPNTTETTHAKRANVRLEGLKRALWIGQRQRQDQLLDDVNEHVPFLGHVEVVGTEMMHAKAPHRLLVRVEQSVELVRAGKLGGAAPARRSRLRATTHSGGDPAHGEPTRTSEPPIDTPAPRGAGSAAVKQTRATPRDPPMAPALPAAARQPIARIRTQFAAGDTWADSYELQPMSKSR